MANQQLIDYIREARNSGIDEDLMRQTLLGGGWSEADINESFSALASQAEPKPPQPPLAQTALPIFRLPFSPTFNLILIGAGIGIYFISLYFLRLPPFESSGVSAITPTPTITPIPSPTLEVLDTSNWKTYRNEEYGFEFKYPSDLYDKSDDVTLRLTSSPLNLYTGGGVAPEGIEGENWIKGYEIFVDKTDIKNVNLISDVEYKVSKLDYPLIEAYSISADVPSSGPSIYIKNPYIINSFVRIGYNNGLQTTEEVDKIFNQILSTFRFLESK